MSIAFGADGLEHQLKHLKAQNAAKDAELNSLRNELHKKGELMAAEKLAKEDAMYRGQREAERADTAEKNLSAKTADLATMRQQLYNLESSLKNSDEKLKKAEKENQRIQYDLDCASSNNAEEATRKLQDEKRALHDKLQNLEGTLRKKESEIDELRRDGGGSGWGAQGTSRSDKARMSALENEVATLRDENVKLKTAVPLPSSPPRKGMTKSHTSANFFGNSFSPAPTSSKTRRRSTSLTDPRIAELEAEVQSLRASGGSDSDGLRVKLSAAITARDKLENQKLALEKSSKREISELREQLDSLKDEVEFYRANEGSSSGGSKKGKDDGEKIKKELNAKIAELEERIRKKGEEIKALEETVARIPELEAELDELRASASSASPLEDSSEKVENLERKIASLTGELETLRNAPPAPAPAGSTALTKQIRQLQRDLDTVNRERDALKAAVEENDDLIAQKDEELFALKRAIPVPGSPVLAPTSGADESVVQALRGQVAELELEKADLLEAKAQATVAMEEQSTKIAALTGEIAGHKEKLASAQADASATRAELVSAQTAHQKLTSTLAEKVQLLATEQKKLVDLSAQLEGSSSTLQELDTAKGALLEKEDNLNSARQDLEIARNAIQAIQAQRDQASTAHDAMVERLQKMEQDLEGLHMEKGSTVAAISKLETELAYATQAQREEEASSAALRIELETASASLQSKIKAYDALEEQYREAGAQIASLEQERAELQETIADRSTESEARVRDEQLWEWKERAATLKKQLSAARAEHKREVVESKFLREQDTLEAQRQAGSLQTRVMELETRIASLSAEIATQVSLVQRHELRIAQLTALPVDESEPPSDEKRHVQLLHTKIDQLRSHRDELRQRISYLTHESRFALSAAEVDKASALEDLQRVRSELSQRGDAYSKLQEELANSQTSLGEVSARLSSAEASFATASSDKHDLADKIAQLELDLARIEKDRADMEESIQEKVGECAKATGLQQKAERQLAIAKASVKSLERRIEQQDALRQADAEGQDGAPRTRTISGSSTSESEQLSSRVEYLTGKVSRREDVIETLKRDLERSRVSEKMAKETIEENEEELVELEEKVAALQTELASKTSELLAAQLASKGLSEDLEARTSELAALRTEHETVTSNIKSTAAQVVSLDAARLELQNEISNLKTQESDLRQNLVDQQAEVKSLSSRIVDLQMTQDELQQKLDESEKRETALVDQLASVKFGELETANSRIAELESQLAEGASEITKLQGELEALVADLAAADEAHSAALVRAKVDTDLASSASAAELASLQKQIAAFEAVIAHKSAEIDRATPEMERLRDELANECSISKKASAEAAVHRGQATSLQCRVDEVEGSLKEAQSGNAALQAKIALLQDSASVTTSSHAKLVNDLLAEQKQKEELKARVDDLGAKLEEAVELKTHQEGLMQSLKKNLESAEEISKRNASLLKYHENEAKAGAKATKMLQEQLITAQKASSAATDKLRDVQDEVQKLSSECERLKTDLASAGAPSGGGPSSGEVEELKETVANLEASLNLKNQELDEADDRIREAYTAKNKAEKKVAKLTRQLAAKETETQTAINTAMNAKLAAAPPTSTPAPAPAARAGAPSATTTPKSTVNVFAAPTPKIEMPPPPIPAPKSASVPASPSSNSTGTGRQALRAKNIFDRDNTTSESLNSTAGAKRLREDVAEEKLPADAIMLPPVKLQPSPSRPPKGFAPSRNSVFAPKSPKENAYVSASPRAATNNIFSRTPTHTRNAFSTSQLPSTSPFTR